MPREIEVKIKPPDAAGLRRRLRALGMRIAKPRAAETNWIFDRAGRLRRADTLLRLRRSGETWTLTAKGPRRPGALKNRQELESPVANGPAMRRLLELLGFSVQMAYRRHRTVWRVPGESGELAWDETPMGVYIELEGSPGWIRATAAALGLDLRAAEPRSYPALYAAHAAGKARRVN